MIKHITIEMTRQTRQLLARVDFSVFTTFSKYLFASFVDFFACSMLKSILSNIVPYSTTKVERSLNNTANSFIVLTKLLISWL